MIFVGIDPGKSGAIAFYNGKDAWAIKLSESAVDIYDAILEVTPEFAMLEHVHSSPQMGVKSAFSFGESFGMCQTLLSASKVPYQLVRPQKWMKEMDCMTKGNKNVTKDYAQRMFPTIAVTHAIADALILAVYAQRVYQGEK